MRSHLLKENEIAGNPISNFLFGFFGNVLSGLYRGILQGTQARAIPIFSAGLLLSEFLFTETCCPFSFFSFKYIVEKKENSNTCIVRLQSHRRITSANPVASKVPFTKTIFPESFYISFQHVVYLDFVSGKWHKGRTIHTVSSWYFRE